MSGIPIATRILRALIASLVFAGGIAGVSSAQSAFDARLDGTAAITGLDLIGGDCNDTNADIYPAQAELVGNRKDDNCNGLADEAANGDPSTDTNDNDGDTYSLAQGDCDDTNANVSIGASEVAGNLIDDDCDGLADEDADGNPSSDVEDHDQDGVTIGSDRIFFSGFEVG